MKVLNCETSRVACHSTGMISGRVVIVRGHLDLKKCSYRRHNSC